MRRLRVLLPVLVLVLVVVASMTTACSHSSGDLAADAGAVGTTAAVGQSGFALVATDNGVLGLHVGASAPAWEVAGGVAAIDGSALFALSSEPAGGSGVNLQGNGTRPPTARLVQFDATTGSEMRAWPIAAMSKMASVDSVDSVDTVSAVSPDGRWVALTDRGAGEGQARGLRPVTALAVFDTTLGRFVFAAAIEGDIEPESFSVDGGHVFALRYFADYYRVQNIQLIAATEFDMSDVGTQFKQYDTPDRDIASANGNGSEEVEEMHGTAVQAVLSSDRRVLSTLYRQPNDADEPAFVHVLDLEHNWSYCVDLPASFAATNPADLAIVESAHHTILVGNTASSTTAEIDVQDVRVPDPATPVALEIRSDPNPPALPDGVRDIPGYRHLIAVRQP